MRFPGRRGDRRSVRRPGRTSANGLPAVLVVAALVAGATIAPAVAPDAPGAGVALAQPAPPPNPDDEQLRRSRDEVAQRAGEVAGLSTRLTELDVRADDLAAELALRREDAEAAALEQADAMAAAVAAQRRAATTRAETDAAGAAIDDARRRLDEFAAARYADGLDAGPIGLLTGTQTPEDLVAKAEFTDLIARTQLAAQDGLERARVAKANSDAAARAARDEAQAAEVSATAAQQRADAAYGVAESAAAEQAARLAEVQTERDQVQGLLDAAESTDAGLRERRDRFEQWEREQAALRAAEARAARAAAAAREAAASAAPSRVDDARPRAGGGGGRVQRVIDRAMSQLGVQYVWGGGNGRGPSTGIPDRFGSPLNRVGFDCSGLMLYAFNGAGVSLPRVSRNQFHAGRQVPIGDVAPGDMVFFRNGNAPIHHVAMYIGDGKMIEAPYTGADVRVVPLRTRGLLPQATRVL